jgi:hypothetical protein
VIFGHRVLGHRVLSHGVLGYRVFSGSSLATLCGRFNGLNRFLGNF